MNDYYHLIVLKTLLHRENIEKNFGFEYIIKQLLNSVSHDIENYQGRYHAKTEFNNCSLSLLL